MSVSEAKLVVIPVVKPKITTKSSFKVITKSTKKETLYFGTYRHECTQFLHLVLETRRASCSPGPQGTSANSVP